MYRLKRLLVTVLVTIGAAGIAGRPAAGQTPGRPDLSSSKAVEKEILRLEEIGRQKALRGDANWDDLIEEDAYMIAFDGSVIRYKRGLNLPSPPVKTFTLSEMIARPFGDAVVVTGLAEVESQTPDKQPISFKMRFINVWKRSGGGWKIVVSERTTVRPVPGRSS